MKRNILLFFIFAILFQASGVRAVFDNRPYDPKHILITFDKSKIDLTTKEGKEKAKEFIKLQEKWKNLDFIEYQNLAVIDVDKDSPDHNDNQKKLEKESAVAIEIVDKSGYGKAQRNIYYQTAFNPNDNDYKYQESFYQKIIFNGQEIGFLANEAWDKTERKISENPASSKVTYANNATIALIDVGLRKEDFVGKDLSSVIYRTSDNYCSDYNGKRMECPMGGINTWAYLNFGANGQDYNKPIAFNRHGSVLARIMAGISNNNFGYAGINNIISSKPEPVVKIMPIKVGGNIFKERVIGDDYISSAQLIAGIHFARMNNADLITLAVKKNSTTLKDYALKEAIKIAGDSGIFTITPDWGLCSDSQIESEYQSLTKKNKEKINPLICVSYIEEPETFWQMPFKKEISKEKKIKTINIDLAKNSFIDLKKMPQVSFEYTRIKKRIDILSSGEYPNFIYDSQQERDEYAYFYPMSESTACAFVAGSMAHLLRFRIVPKEEKSLLRCVMENASDEMMTIGYTTGKLFRLLNLKKMVNFSGDFLKCSELAKSRQSIPGIVAKINKFEASLKDKKYEYKAEIEFPKNSGDIEYIVATDENNYIKIGRIGDDDNKLFVTWFDQGRTEMFLESEHCLKIYARNKKSILVGQTEKLCLMGTELINGKDAMIFDIVINEKELEKVIETKNEQFVKVDLILTKSKNSSFQTGDLFIDIEWKDWCEDWIPDEITTEAQRIIKNAKRIGNQIQYKKITFDKNGKWKQEISLPIDPVSGKVITATFVSLEGKEQKMQKVFFLDSSKYHSFYNLSIEADPCIYVQRLDNETFHLGYSVKIPSSRKESDYGIFQIVLPENIKIIDMGDNVERVVGNKNQFKVRAEKTKNLGRTLSFTFTLKIPQAIHSKMKNNLLVLPYEDSRFYFKNKEGIAIDYPLFYVMGEDDFRLNDNQENSRSNNYYQSYSLTNAFSNKLIQKEIKITRTIFGNERINLVAQSYLTSDQTVKVGWFEVYAKNFSNANIRLVSNISKSGTISAQTSNIIIPQDGSYCIKAVIISSLGQTYQSEPVCPGLNSTGVTDF